MRTASDSLLMSHYLQMRGLLLCIFILLFTLYSESESKESPVEWKKDWVLSRSFAIEIDSEGFHFPTSIAFVPRPGTRANDVLYYVTELRGSIKAVSNDRTVHTFAENFFLSRPQQELPSTRGEVGMAGVCLDSEQGYVFVTYAHHNQNGLIYNDITRFSAVPQKFSTVPFSRVDFTEVFRKYESGVSHQIGNCQVADGMLYVGVGDAFVARDSQRIDRLRGKILRFTTNGKPVAGNPLRVDGDKRKPRNFIYASGLRNPFALRLVQGRLFAVDNGNDIDRFLEITKGKNYLWDGTDWSIGASALAVFRPTIGPVQLDYLAESNPLFPSKYDRNFFVSSSHGDIIHFAYELQQNDLVSVPKHFLKLVPQVSKDQPKNLTGLAFGPDGLYFAALYPNRQGKTPVYKVQYKPGYEHEALIETETDPWQVMKMKGCFSCHGMTEFPKMVGPSLEKKALSMRIKTRIESKQYIESVKKLNQIKEEPYISFESARNQVLSTPEKEKVRVWMKYHLMEPRFDNPDAQMPNLGLTEEQAIGIAKFLAVPVTAVNQPVSILSKIQLIFSPLSLLHPFYSFGFGVAITIIITALFNRVRRDRDNRHKKV